MKRVMTMLLIITGLITGCTLSPTVPERLMRVAFMSDRDGDFEIYLANRDGSHPTNLTGDEAADGIPTWSSAAGAFVFLTNRGTSQLSIYRMDREGGELILLAENPPAIPIPMSWSSTGDWIAFGGGTGADVYLLDAAGENLVNLTDHPAQDNFEAWSPDGQQILFTSDRDGTLAIYKVSVEGGEPTRLTGPEAANGAPDWSPDGSKIAFMSNRDGNTEIYIMDASGENVIRLTDDEGFDGFPAWSPDSTKIAFLSLRDGNSEIYLMNPDGSEQTNLTNSPTGEESLQGDFAWSPDGQQILFHTDRDGNVEVYVMDADGGHPTNLSNNPATDLGSTWVQ